MACGPVRSPPLAPTFIAWEVGVKAGSPSGLGLMTPQARLCINKDSGLTLEEGVNYPLPFLCGWAAQLAEQQHQSHEYGSFWELLLPPFKALG